MSDAILVFSTEEPDSRIPFEQWAAETKAKCLRDLAQVLDGAGIAEDHPARIEGLCEACRMIDERHARDLAELQARRAGRLH